MGGGTGEDQKLELDEILFGSPRNSEGKLEGKFILKCILRGLDLVFLPTSYLRKNLELEKREPLAGIFYFPFLCAEGLRGMTYYYMIQHYLF